jgi:hypothetical protein
MKWRSILSAISKSAMTPSLSGRITTIDPGRAAEHLLGFGADGENATPTTRVLPDRHHRGFIAYDTLALDVDQRVGGSQINGEIFRKPAIN